MPNVIDALKKRTAKNQRRIAEKQTVNRERAAQDDKVLQQRMRNHSLQLFTKCQEKAEAVADKGESQVLVSVMENGDEPYPKWCEYLARYTRELLENAGFNVKVVRHTMEPFGSDPMFNHTVYSTYLRISWSK